MRAGEVRFLASRERSVSERERAGGFYGSTEDRNENHVCDLSP